ncbi:MAG: response regulator transcription factor [Chitinophagales bacterium]|nr:response regulator transcription factor [Chitinophagales bacterium]
MLNAIKEVYEGGTPMTLIVTRVLQMFLSNGLFEIEEGNDLNNREKEIHRYLTEGMNYGIANTCYISVETFSGHIKNICKKLQVHLKSQAVIKVIKNKIV